MSVRYRRPSLLAPLAATIVMLLLGRQRRTLGQADAIGLEHSRDGMALARHRKRQRTKPTGDCYCFRG